MTITTPDIPPGLRPVGPRDERAYAWTRIPQPRVVGLLLHSGERLAVFQLGATQVVSTLAFAPLRRGEDPMWLHALTVTRRGRRAEERDVDRVLADFAVEGERWTEVPAPGRTEGRVFVLAQREGGAL